VIHYLYVTRSFDSFWFDKWQTSPLYTTAHAIMICSDFHQPLIENSIKWLLGRQNADGSWGYYDVPTAEETAYALQALSIWKRHGGKFDSSVLSRGLEWLNEHENAPRPHLWIAKSLNYSEWIIQTELIMARALVEEVS